METLQRTANRGSLATGYDIDNSLKFEPDNTESLTKSAATGGDRKKATLSLWCKRTELTGSQASILFLTGVNGNKYTTLAWGTGDEINFHYYNTGSYTYNFLTDREFRDTSAWYHIVVAVDTTQSTASDRVKFYVNGVQETSFSTEVYPTQNIDTPFNNDSATYPMEIGNDSVFSMGGDALAGYLADYYLIDGQQLAPTEFGEVDEDSGIWIPKAYTGTFGNNGFYLDFENSGSLGADSSGNSNNFTPINITSADQATDTPTNNFCTFNVLQNNTTSGANPTFTEGATVVNRSTGAGWMVYITTIPVNKGKWYAEFELERTNALQMQGTLPVDYAQTAASTTEYYLGAQANGDGGVGWYGSGSNVYHNGGFTSSTAADGGDIIGVAVDCDNNKVHFRVNATWTNSSDPSQGNSGGFAINDELTFIVLNSQPANRTYKANFGGYTTISISSAASDANGYGTFEYAPPTGYYALCTKNLAEEG